MNYKVEDNYLSRNSFQDIKTLLEEPRFCWNYRSSQTDDYGKPSTEVPYFYHTFYEIRNVIDETGMRVLNPLLQKIDSNILLHVRANLTIKQTDDDFCKPHKDEYTQTLSHKTSVFMMTNCNAKTILQNENGENIEVESVENRLLTFDANITHFVEYQTDTKNRMVININHMRV